MDRAGLGVEEALRHVGFMGGARYLNKNCSTLRKGRRPVVPSRHYKKKHVITDWGEGHEEKRSKS